MKQLLLILGVITLLTFLFLGKHPISPWDEARTGVNAIEMLQNGDWVNIHYAGQPDTWQVKPPLGVWAVATSFSIFGKTEWALRLPSALAMLGAFFFIFKIIRLFRSANFALWICLLLASVDGLIGWHVGRTADFDAMLVFFLLGGLYFLCSGDLFKQKKDGIPRANFWRTGLVGLFWGLAFLTKGPAAGVLVPGLILFFFIEKKLWKTFKQPAIWGAAATALAFPIGWGLTQYFYGIRYVETVTGGTAFERMFLQDLVKRFTQQGEGWKSAFSPDFFFYSLDKTFNIWNYIFFGFLLFGIIWLVKNRQRTISVLRNEKHRLLLLSLCLYFPLAIFLTLAAKSNSWYLAPVLPFVGIATFWGIDFLWKKYRQVKFLFFGLLIFTLSRQVWDFVQPENKPSFIIENASELKNANAIYQSGQIEQDVLLYLYFLNDRLKFKRPDKLNSGEIWVKASKGHYVLEEKL